MEANDYVIVRTCAKFFRGADLEDACQDVRLKAFRSLPQFRGEAKLSTWLYRVAFTICLMRVRAERPLGESLDELREDSHFDIRDVRPDPYRAVKAKEAVDQLGTKPLLRVELMRISAQVDGMTIAEMAAIEQVKIGTMKPRIRRGRLRLKAALLHERA